MSEEENKAIARRALEEIFSGQGNLEVADEIISPNFVGHDPVSPEDSRGPEGVKEFAMMYRNAFPDVQLSVEDQVAEGDMVVTRWTASGTHREEFLGVPPTGSQITMSGIEFDRVIDGKIDEAWVSYHFFTDSALDPERVKRVLTMIQ